MTAIPFSWEAHLDPDDPLKVHTFTIPAGLIALAVEASGGGTFDPLNEVPLPPTYGISISTDNSSTLSGIAGRVLSVVLGGTADGTTGGTNGGGAGGGGEPWLPLDRPWRSRIGAGGGGATVATLSGSSTPWVVAGGAGGATDGQAATASGVVPYFVAPAAPGPDDPPRVPYLGDFPPDPEFDYVDLFPGATGSEFAGADGDLYGPVGAGGGGAGWGGGAAGSIAVRQLTEEFGGPWYANEIVSTAGEPGGLLVPAGFTSGTNAGTLGDTDAGWIRVFGFYSSTGFMVGSVGMA